ncbi:DEAD/DEAH box helicase [Desulfatiglans anilini]|uniref:DEAD/DEAH box helicase n=1 Tax=Desulfatiglans anilini TaxID=90728 RepID=UPI0003FA8507|nr:DEAD/DEAH box helicase [Desulfatiglans anilini]
MNHTFAPGARIEVRDAEWVVRRVDRTSTGGLALSVTGVSEIVRDKSAVFLTEIEKKIEVLDPAQTRLVPDRSSSYEASILYMESLLRRKPPTDEKLYIGHEAAMDLVPFQLDPAVQALRQPRQRILIADAVGLGKTLEAGVLLSELILRGRGKRILVVAVKSMLTQFQKEMWTRFTIPLVRLDSIGIQRVRSRIPTNQNPFYYYDKAIISIDTLKQDAEYRTYIESAYWDIIVIDEAHNVAERGNSLNMRARLAKLLARRSDTLILLSATPHDGKARSFASLMNMLDPTAIADPEHYGPEDIRGLYIRRFKKDIQEQVAASFKERRIAVAHCDASAEEEAAFDTLTDREFARIDQQRSGGLLFRTTLEKALFSSPAACIDTIRHRIVRLRKLEDEQAALDIQSLEALAEGVGKVAAQQYSKYRKLLEVIRDPLVGFGWKGDDESDRLVIFTERIETLRFLHTHLPRDLGLKERAVAVLHGGMSDVDQQQTVEEFGKDESPVRLLLASDVASEGINLHYLSHRMIHFDIPWSLMVFQQRNGRIDRYGQERTPEIVYLVTRSVNPKIRGDMRILELLIAKDEEVVRNIGDPAEFMGVHDIAEEEALTASAMEAGKSPEEFEAFIRGSDFDDLAVLLGEVETPVGRTARGSTAKPVSLFPSTYDYLAAAISHLRRQAPFEADLYPAEQRLDLTAPPDLSRRFRFLPREIVPEDGRLVLSADRDLIQAEIRRSRKEEKAWPLMHYLWDLHPVVDWVNDKLLAAFGRHEAPVLELSGGLGPEEAIFVMSGLIPNRKSHPLVHEWFGVGFSGGAFRSVEPLDALGGRLQLGRRSYPNRGQALDVDALRLLLPEAVSRARAWMSERREAFEEGINAKLNQQLEALERLKAKQLRQLEFEFGGSRQPEKIVEARREARRREVDRIFDEYFDWVEDTLTTEDHPHIQVIAVLKG